MGYSQVLAGYKGGTRGYSHVLTGTQGYSRGTRGVLEGYCRNYRGDTQWGYSWVPG
jgi:hypothetical protein